MDTYLGPAGPSWLRGACFLLTEGFFLHGFCSPLIDLVLTFLKADTIVTNPLDTENGLME